MRFVLYIYFFLLSNFIFCHSEIFDITKGEFITNQDFNKNYSFNLFFKQDVFVDEIGVDFIDFGDDNFANLEIKVYNNDSLIYSKKEKFLEKNGQIVYFGLNKLFQSNKEYVFLILNLDIYSHNDNKITLFKPSFLPYNEKSNIFRTNKLGASIDSIPNFETSNLCPFVHIGATTQAGVYFSNMDKVLDVEEIPYGFSRSTKFKIINPNININGIGFSYYDSGIDNKSLIKMRVYDVGENRFLFSVDTMLNNHHRSPFFIKTNFDFLPNRDYLIEVDFLDDTNKDDLIVLYKPYLLPYEEISKNIGIVGFCKNKIEDSLGLPFALKCDDKPLLLSKSELSFLTVVFNSNKQLSLQLPCLQEDFIKFELFSLSGKKLATYSEAIVNNKIEINNVIDLESIVILKFTTNNNSEFSKLIYL